MEIKNPEIIDEKCILSELTKYLIKRCKEDKILDGEK